VLPEDSAQFASQKFRFPISRPDDVSYCPDAHLSKASSVRTMRTFCPDLPLCRKVSNCSSLYPSRRFSSISERHSVLDKLQDFFPKHSYGKIAATVRTRSSIRQVSYSKAKPLNANQHGPDPRASDMEIACIKSTVRTIIPLVRTYEALIWKLLAAEVQPSGCGSKTGKNFSEILGKSIAQLSVWMAPSFY
jgi:hypothetical protein